MSRKVLGRGLEALISSTTANDAAEGRTATATEALPDGHAVLDLPISHIGPNPFQPRTRFDDTALKELADSIRASGVLQPVSVRRNGTDDYQLVAGERRLRAAHLAGLTTVPAIVREYDDRQMMELALIENIQREDLNPIDEAKAYQALIERVGLTHDQVSERVGKQRSSITNSLRLLGLPGDVMDMVSRGTLSAGHARAILALDNAGEQLAAARYVVGKGFSVRRTEAFVRRKHRKTHSRPKTARLDGLDEWQVKLQQRFATRVAITPGRKGGTVTFEFYGQEDLERLLEAWGVL
jgi:ParB family chromosome partitioning protein